MIEMLFSPITSKEYLERIEKTRRMMANQGIDLMLAYADPWKSGNCRYLTGIRPSRAMMEVPDVGYAKQMFSLPLKGEHSLWVTDWEDGWVKRRYRLSKKSHG